MASGTSLGGPLNPDQQDQAGRLLAGMLYAVVRSMVDAGVRPQQAMRLAAFAVLEGEFGRDAILQLGMPGRTERRWRQELAEALADAELPDEPPLRLVNEMLPLLGITGLELRVKD